MSAEILREAAALMRERAEGATAGPWFAVASGIEGSGTVFHDKHVLHNDAEHIAGMGPAVALKVAKSLEQAAAIIDEADSGPLAMAMNAIAEPLVDVARAYLNTP